MGAACSTAENHTGNAKTVQKQISRKPQQLMATDGAQTMTEQSQGIGCHCRVYHKQQIFNLVK